ESTLGSAKDPGGAGEAWIQGFSQNSRQVYATNPSSRAIFKLAVIPEPARLRDLGVRLLLRPNACRQVLHVHVTPNPTALLGGSANGRMLRLGSQAAMISRS